LLLSASTPCWAAGAEAIFGLPLPSVPVPVALYVTELQKVSAGTVTSVEPSCVGVLMLNAPVPCRTALITGPGTSAPSAAMTSPAACALGAVVATHTPEAATAVPTTIALFNNEILTERSLPEASARDRSARALSQRRRSYGPIPDLVNRFYGDSLGGCRRLRF